MPATRAVSRAVRLMAMRDLMTAKLVTVYELQRRFDVSRSTVYRDLQDLQLTPIEFELGTAQVWGARELLGQLSE